MKERLLEWLLDNLPGKASYCKIAILNSFREMCLDEKDNISIKMTRDYYQKLARRLNTRVIPGIALLDGQGDYVEIVVHGDTMIIESKTNLTRITIKNRFNGENQHKIIININNDLSSELILEQTNPTGAEKELRPKRHVKFDSSFNEIEKHLEVTINDNSILLRSPVSYADLEFSFEGTNHLSNETPYYEQMINNFISTLPQFIDIITLK